jgi:hypothetical protein
VFIEHVNSGHANATVFEVTDHITTETTKDAVEEVGTGYGGHAALVSGSDGVGVAWRGGKEVKSAEEKRRNGCKENDDKDWKHNMQQSSHTHSSVQFFKHITQALLNSNANPN